MSTQPIQHRLQSHTMYEKASFIQDYAVKVQMVLDKDRSAKQYKVRDIRDLQSLIEEKSDNLDSIYIKWIIQKYSQNKMQMVEDILSKAIPALERYQDLKKRNQLQLTHKNLQRIKDIHELLDIMDEYQDAQSRSEKKDSVEQGFYDRGEAELVHNDSKIKVVIPKTEKASCYFGMGTKWCTTGDRNNMFNDYTRDGYDLHYIFFKGVTSKRNYKWAVAWRRKRIIRMELFDAKNKEPKLQMLLRIRNKYPILQEIFKNALPFSTSPSNESQIAAVKRDANEIKYIENPSEEIQLAAVEEDGSAIQFIRNPSEKIQRVAVKATGYALEFIKNPTKKIQLLAVERNGFSIMRIKKPSEKVQLAAVKNNAEAIKCIKRPTEKVQIAAVEADADVIDIIENPSEEVQLAAVEQYGFLIENIENPTEKVKIAAVRKKYPISGIEKPSEKVKLAAVERFGLAIKDIKKPSLKVQLAAVRQNVLALKHIKNPDQKVLDYVRSVKKKTKKKKT